MTDHAAASQCQFWTFSPAIREFQAGGQCQQCLRVLL